MKTSGIIMKAGKAGGDRCVYGIDGGDGFMGVYFSSTHQAVYTKYVVFCMLLLCQSSFFLNQLYLAVDAVAKLLSHFSRVPLRVTP